MTDVNLSELFETMGTPCEVRTGKPLWLRGSDSVWLVSTSKVDVFLAKKREGHPDSALHPLFRVEAGQILCGMPERGVARDWELAATGAPGNRLYHLDRTHLRELSRQDPVIAGQAADLLEHWVEQLSSPLAEWPPGHATLLEPDIVYPATPGEVFLARQQTLWLLPTAGEFRFLGRAEALIRPDSGFFPLPRLFWLETTQPGFLRAVTGGEYCSRDEHWAGLNGFHNILLTALILQVDNAEAQEQQRLTRKVANEAQNIRHAMLRLSAILSQNDPLPVPEENAHGPWLAACHLVGHAADITFVAPVVVGEDAKRDVLGDIVEASRVRHRRVALKGSWWNKDSGHLLGFLEEGKRPVALLKSATGYIQYDPVSGTALPVTAEVAASLQPFAFCFYRSFGNTLVNLGEMIRFGVHGHARDLRRLVTMGIVIGLLGLITPLSTGILFDTVIPGADKSQLAHLTLALLAGAFATAMFEVTRGFTLLRIVGQMDASIQSAMWDRLLRLPAPFFREYLAGDLATRANGISTIRQTLWGNTLYTLLSAVFAIFNLFLLFYYSLPLALLGIVLVAIAILFSFFTSLLRLRYQRKLADIGGQVSGLVFQLLGSIAKLRASGAESRAFYNWAQLYARQQEQQFKAKMVGSATDVFNSVFPILGSMALFFVIAFVLDKDQIFSTGTFLAFNAAFGGFLSAMLSATTALTRVLGIIPIYERMKPILQTLPEITDRKAHPGQLSGDIEIDHLSFSYTPEGPQILKDISLHIKPGEFVALVGSSGSGKSTLLRLLLGFESPTSGSIYYDRQDLSGIDLGALRRQLGVVLQNGRLLSGDIFTNIIGSATQLTLDDAWEAATQAGIASDIRDMPMGMHTLVSDGGGTLSGGQSQRLLIARAIVNRPRILFFDEATSALDNRAQEMVSTSLENLRATRIVIAHRLSTILNADRIYVMDGGELVQTGTYQELIEREGLFADLARRQLV
ncbi:ABC transporter [Gammaproteobacteria bacterium]